MSLPKARTHKQYQEFVKKEFTLRGIKIPFIFQDVFIKLFYLDLSPVRFILKERYSHQGAPARPPEDMLRSALAKGKTRFRRKPKKKRQSRSYEGVIKKLVDKVTREDSKQKDSKSSHKQPDYLLQKIFKECFVFPSAKLGIIDLENLSHSR